MARELSPGVVTEDLPEDTTQPVDKTQFPNQPCDPAAIHDLYAPIGSKDNPVPKKNP